MGGLLLAFIGRVPAWAWGVLLLALWGWWGNHQAATLRHQVARQAEQLQAANTRTEAAEQFRQAERQAATKQREISDDLSRAQAARSARAAAVDRRLQQLAQQPAGGAGGAAAGATCRRDDAPAVAALPDETRRDLVALADEADAISERLGACQRYIREVVPLLANTPPQHPP